MNIDWVVVSVIASVVAMIIATGAFIYYAMKHVDEDKSQDN
ncbi:hypothetical protein LCGC14_0742810 [marine sediment metagenome]|uniref:Uncharacterized protein n=1 Tax=marine sediment metagenome TaxID=412755 RepID=A0A0F9QRA4_9ZZZZ